MIVPRYVALAEYVRQVESREPFAQAGYGDGEWLCILGAAGANCNGEPYVPEIRDALRRSLTEPTGHWCGHAPLYMQAEAEAWILAHNVSVPWVHKETFSESSIAGAFAPMLAAFRSRRLIVVGPQHLAALPVEHFGAFRHLVIPDGSAWTVVSETDQRLRAAIEISPEPPLVLVASGMAANMLIHPLWPWAQAHGASLFDCGASLDPYAGVWSRDAYRTPWFQQAAMLRNLT